MKQLDYTDADKIAKDAAARAIGFGPSTGKVTIDASEVIAVAERAAWIALEKAGLLASAHKSSDRLNSELAKKCVNA